MNVKLAIGAAAASLVQVVSPATAQTIRNSGNGTIVVTPSQRGFSSFDRPPAISIPVPPGSSVTSIDSRFGETTVITRGRFGASETTVIRKEGGQWTVNGKPYGADAEQKLPQNRNNSGQNGWQGWPSAFPQTQWGNGLSQPPVESESEHRAPNAAQYEVTPQKYYRLGQLSVWCSADVLYVGDTEQVPNGMCVSQLPADVQVVASPFRFSPEHKAWCANRPVKMKGRMLPLCLKVES